MKCNCVEQKEPPKLRVIDHHHRVGANISLQKTLYETLTQKAANGSHCSQFFLGSRQGYKTRKLGIDDINRSKEYCEKYGKTFYIHTPLITNLSKNPESRDEKELKILSNSWNSLKSQIKYMNGLPAGCVLHCGSRGSINNLIRNLNDFAVPRNRHISQSKLLLMENSAGQGSSIGVNFEEMRKIFEGIDTNTIGFCLDTQHIYGAGVNSLETHEDVVKLFDEMENVYGDPDVIHLNDSKKLFGSRVDRHENIGSGYIWSQESEGLRTLLDICYDKDIDCVLETPDSCRDIDLIRSKYMDLNTIDVVTKSL